MKSCVFIPEKCHLLQRRSNSRLPVHNGTRLHRAHRQETSPFLCDLNLQWIFDCDAVGRADCDGAIYSPNLNKGGIEWP